MGRFAQIYESGAGRERTLIAGNAARGQQDGVLQDDATTR